MQFTQDYLEEREKYIEEKVEEHNQNVYKGGMDAHNKSTLRRQLREEYDFEMRQAIRQDNSTGSDLQ